MHTAYKLVANILPRAFIFALALLVSSGFVYAAIFNVEAGDVAGLVAAIDAANTNDEADSIILEAGSFNVLFSDADAIQFAQISSEISISGSGPEPTLIQRPPDEFWFNFLGVGEMGHLTLRNLTIKGGYTSQDCGGAITVIRGSMMVQNVTFLDNYSRFSGGAICNLGGVIVVDNSVFKGNKAGNYGGAIHNDDSGQSGTLNIIDSIFEGNESSRGGALYNDNSELTIQSSVIVSNVSSGSGGGIGAEHSGSPEDNIITIQDCTIEGNSAQVSGGGLDLHSSTATITGSTISHNSTELLGGGGIYSGFGSQNISNSTISGNRAGDKGGGIRSAGGSGDGSITLNNITLFANVSGGEGAGIYNNTSKQVRFRNSIVAGNSNPNGPSDCVGQLSSSGYNLVQTKPEECLFFNPNDIIGEAPLLGPLSNNGGLTRTHNLVAGSPAVDHIPPENCAVNTDQRGISRPQGDGCDIGAYELDNISRINPGLNDAWYDETTDGQGFFITVFPDLGMVVLSWFTYDTELPGPGATANLGDPGHRWLNAAGLIDGNQVVMDIDMISGGIFDTSTEIEHTDPPDSDGTITLTFHHCNSATIEYDIPSINRQGTVPIKRVANDNIVLCEALNAE